MKIKPQTPIAFYHFMAEIVGLIGIQYTQGIGQHEVIYRLVFESVHQVKNVFPGMNHAIGPIFQIQIDFKAGFFTNSDFFNDVTKMLLRCFSKLLSDMF